MTYTGSKQSIQVRINLFHRRNESFTIIVVSEYWKNGVDCSVGLFARFTHCEFSAVCKRKWMRKWHDSPIKHL